MNWNIFNKEAIAESNKLNQESKPKLTQEKMQELLKGEGLNIGITSYQELQMMINDVNSILSQLSNSPLVGFDKSIYKFGLQIRNPNNTNTNKKMEATIKNKNDILELAKWFNTINTVNYDNIDLYVTVNFS